VNIAGVEIDTSTIDDPLLGRAYVLTCPDGRTTTMSAVDWSRPTTIPTVAAPGVLPPGAGGAIMNTIAERARSAGVRALRYAGRYPTAALFKTLLRSFRTTATEEEFTSHFRLAGKPVEIPIDFVPAPFTRIENRSGFVEMRDGQIERAVVDRVSFEIGGSPARLVELAHANTDRDLEGPNTDRDLAGPNTVRDLEVPNTDRDLEGSNTGRDSGGPSTGRDIEGPNTGGDIGDPNTGLGPSGVDGSPHVRAQVWFGDTRYADVATFDASGALIDGPHPIPPSTSQVLGRVFPPALVVALAELIADVVPGPIAEDAKRFLTSKIVRWDDLGARAAMTRDGDILVHAAIWDRIAPLGFPRLALALAEAIGPVVTIALLAEIGREARLMSPGA
jgi:hypothetical protein